MLPAIWLRKWKSKLAGREALPSRAETRRACGALSKCLPMCYKRDFMHMQGAVIASMRRESADSRGGEKADGAGGTADKQQQQTDNGLKVHGER